MKKKIVFLAVCAMALCATSCKKQDPKQNYEWALTCPVEHYATDESKHNLVKDWVDAAVKQIAPQTDGRGEFSDKNQLQPIVSTAENAIGKVVDDFAEARKTYDFGPYDYKSVRVFHVLDKDAKEIYKSPEYTIEYTGVPRFVCAGEYAPKNFSKMIMLAEECTLSETISYGSFELDPQFEAKVAGEPRVYDIKTHEIYTGTPFVSSGKVSIKKSNLDLIVSFKKDKASDYLGSWYMLIPVELKGAHIENIEIMVKVTLL